MAMPPQMAPLPHQAFAPPGFQHHASPEKEKTTALLKQQEALINELKQNF